MGSDLTWRTEPAPAAPAAAAGADNQQGVMALPLPLVTGAFAAPALWVEAGGAILSANAAAQALVQQDPGWWRHVVTWLAAVVAGQAGPLSVLVEGDRGPLVIEWTAALLPGPTLLMVGHDATLERRMRRTLTESRQRYKDLVDISSDFAWECGADSRFVFVSPRGALGYSAEALIGRDPIDLLDPEWDTVDHGPLPFVARRAVDQAELWVLAADGSPVCLSIAALPLFGAEGEWIGTRGVCRDITRQIDHAAELARMRTNERMVGHIGHMLGAHVDLGEALDEAAAETVQALGAVGCRIYRLTAGDAFSLEAAVGSAHLGELAGEGGCALAGGGGSADGHEPGGAAFGSFGWLLAALGANEGVLAIAHEGRHYLASRTRYRGQVNGALVLWREAGNPAWTAEDQGLVAAIADRVGVAQAHLAYQERLRRLSERDGLTGLFNRRTFFERLAELLSRPERGTSAVLYIDVDNFKPINDRFGHQQGDQVLKMVSALIGRNVRPGDLAGRLGGDEFIVWLARAGEAGAVGVARRLLRAVADLVPLSATADRPLGLSIGIAVAEGGIDETPQSLIDRADAAMYAAKAEGKGAYAVAPVPVRDATETHW